MRELTKSILSLSWALPLFGIKQLSELALPRDMSQPFGSAARSLDAVTAAATGQLGSDAWQGAFKSGDQFQRGVVDLVFGWFSLDALNPESLVRTTTEVLQRSVQAAGRVIPGCGGCGGQGAGSGRPAGR